MVVNRVTTFLTEGRLYNNKTSYRPLTKKDYHYIILLFETLLIINKTTILEELEKAITKRHKYISNHFAKKIKTKEDFKRINDNYGKFLFRYKKGKLIPVTISRYKMGRLVDILDPIYLGVRGKITEYNQYYSIIKIKSVGKKIIKSIKEKTIKTKYKTYQEEWEK